MYFVDMLLMINLIAMGWDVATDDFLESQLRVRHLKSYQNCLSSCRIRCTSPYFKGFFATSSDNYPDEIGIAGQDRVQNTPDLPLSAGCGFVLVSLVTHAALVGPTRHS